MAARGGVRAVVIAVMAVHTLWIAAYVALGHEARDFAHIGRYWVQQSTASETIAVDPDYRYPLSRDAANGPHRGYDGQFAYFLALDPRDAHHYMDAPSYRYARILYPMAARALAAARADLVPYALVVVNWLAVALGTLAVALLLRRRGTSAWWALAYGLAPGMLLALQRDLTEPLAYGLAAAALLVLAGDGRRRFLAAGAIFGLAALARQTTLLIPFVWSVWTLAGWGVAAPPPLRRRARDAALLAAPAVLPYLAWWLVVRSWLGPSESAEPYVLVPLGWIFERSFGLARQPPMVLGVIVPGLLAAGCALWALRRALRPEWACLALQVGAFVVFAPAYNAYTSVGRAVLGIVLVGVLAVPFAGDLPARGRALLAGAGALYLAMAPVVFAYGLTSFGV